VVIFYGFTQLAIGDIAEVDCTGMVFPGCIYVNYWIHRSDYISMIEILEPSNIKRIDKPVQ